MAVARMVCCIKCKKNKEVLIRSGMPCPNICDKCKADADELELDNFLKELEKMSCKERLTRIETIIYKISKNVSKEDTKY